MARAKPSPKSKPGSKTDSGRKGARAKSGAQKSVKPKGKPRGPGRPFEAGNPWRIKKGEVLNPGGRPKLISDAYREWLAAEDEQGVTNAAKVAIAQGAKAIANGDTQAARELRQATEGTRITTWQDDIVKLLKEGQTTVNEVREEFGDDIATELAAAAGLPIGEGGEDPPAGAQEPGE